MTRKLKYGACLNVRISEINKKKLTEICKEERKELSEMIRLFLAGLLAKKSILYELIENAKDN